MTETRASPAPPTRPPVPHACRRKLFDTLADAITRNESLDPTIRDRWTRTLRGASIVIQAGWMYALLVLGFDLFIVLPLAPAWGILGIVLTVGVLFFASACTRRIFDRHFVPTIWAAVDTLRVPTNWVEAWLEYGNFERLFWEIEHRAVPAERAASPARPDEVPAHGHP